MKKLAIILMFICLMSFSFGQVLVSPEPKVVPPPKPKVAPVPPKSIELPKEALVLKFRGTVKDIEREFYTTIEQGIDVIRDRKTNKLITGPFTVTAADGKVVGILNLLKGKMHGEELFFDENGEVKERNYWINGKWSKTPPPKIIPPQQKPVRPNSFAEKKSTNKKKPNRVVNFYGNSFFQFKFKSKEEKALWDSLPNWNSVHYNGDIKDIYKIHTHKLDAFGNLIDENPTKGYTGLAKIVLDFIFEPERMILHLKDGYVVKLEIFNLDGDKCGHHTYKDGKKDGQCIHSFGFEGRMITNYKDGRKEGTETEVYPKGQKKREVNYKDGRKEGTETYWYENGQKKGEVNFKDGKLDGLWTWWNESGQKEREGKNKDGRREGTETYWYESGQKEREVNYKDGEKEVTETYWYESGQKSSERNKSDDIFQGISTTWYEDGEKHAEFSFTDGYLMSAKVWKPNGEISKDSKVTEGNGKIIYYDSEGKEIFHTPVKDGEILSAGFFPQGRF